MTLLLGLDTATDHPTLALAARGERGTDVGLPSRRDLSREIERVTARILAERGARASDLRGLVVADGPGSFTGLRIGVAFAKGLARALGVPLFAVPSLLGAAHAAAPEGGTVIVAYDALRGDVYRAVYRLHGDRPSSIEVLLAPELAPVHAPSPVGAESIRANWRHASAAALLRLVGVPNGATPVADPAAWEPVYGRPAEAEARYLARRGRSAGS